MKSKLRKATYIILTLALILPGNLVLAARLQADIGPCVGDSVTGVIIGIDENGVVTIKTDTGACTVTLNGNDSHPIVALLGMYFGDIQVSDFSGALQGAQGCALVSGSAGSWADCSVEGATRIQFVSFNNGVLTAIDLETGQMITLSIDDSALGESITQALANLTVDWGLDGNGDVIQVSDQIAMYHDQGIGFGALVKLYALANAAGVPVEELIAKFKGDPTTGVEGIGFGQLFKQYGGRPPLTGVGHVKQQLKNQQNSQTNSYNANGYSNGKANGKNNGKANGKNKDKSNGANNSPSS